MFASQTRKEDMLRVLKGRNYMITSELKDKKSLGKKTKSQMSTWIDMN